MLRPARFMPRIQSFFEMLPWRKRFKYTPLALHETQEANVPLPARLVWFKGTSAVQRSTYLVASISFLFVLLLYIGFSIVHKANGSSREQPLPILPSENNGTVHPVSYLVQLSNARFISLQESQSKSLEMAIKEYQRRYALPPPPHFDRWYEFAVQQGTELIDEFDEIHHSLNLFWGIEPGLVRQRVREVLGHDNSLMGATIRNGQIRIVGSGQDEFQVVATQEMLSKFSAWLPDMDLAFNVNDEPRVLVPHEDVDRMLASGIKLKSSVRPKRNKFSRPHDLGEGQSFEPVSETPFNRLDHQQTFMHARMSCPPDSPARSLALDPKDAKLGLTFEEITFVDNITTFSDICLSPSTRNFIGLLNSPNVFAVSHDLLPIFTPSKLSTFHDILYPSPYYYAEKTRYDEVHSVAWDQKLPKLYWRGATSGGYSEGGTWRSLLRQSILSKLQSGGTTRVLTRKGTDINDDVSQWTSKLIDRETVADSYDTKFTDIKQCAPADCTDMRNYFGSNALAPQEESWKNRYLLDMDGNALSGRFYALLESLSLPLKVAYYREWHMSRIFPWEHYVPLTSTTDEYDEIIRFFEEEDDGREIAENLAIQGREWVQKSARKADMEVYMFRLLLE